MNALTVRLSDDKHRRLKLLAKSRGTPLNRALSITATTSTAVAAPASVGAAAKLW